MAGIFWVRAHGAKRKDLPRRYGSKSNVHRWIRVFEELMRWMARLVAEDGSFRLYECFIDGTFARAKRGGDGIGCIKAGTAVTIMILVDVKGLPLAVSTAAANPHETELILGTLWLNAQLPEDPANHRRQSLRQRQARCAVGRRGHRKDRSEPGEPLRHAGRAPAAQYKRR